MTAIRHTPPPVTAGHHERPFTAEPGRWERERCRVLRSGHTRDHTCSAVCEPVLVHERTLWGGLAGTVPGDASPPEIPYRIAVLTPGTTRTQRLALRWPARRPAPRITAGRAWSLRPSAAAVALVSVVAGLVAMSHHVPVAVALPAMLLTPLPAEHLPEHLDGRAREHVHTIEGDAACRSLPLPAAPRRLAHLACPGHRRP
ncbi:hypothetical protein [Streptomyces sp. NPDC001137]|uniref:hypothetical protein n=1 Tax=Streptomyces sp. NPDC001137 TaxID=3154378 RepID=UPI00332A222E